MLTRFAWVCVAAGLAKVTPERVGEALQVSETNPLVGLQGRSQLLNKLGESLKLKDNEIFFGADARPGNMVGTSTHTLHLHCVEMVNKNVRSRPT